MTAPATANMKSLKTNAKQMIVRVLPVRIMEHVKMESIPFHVNVQKALLEQDVKQTLMTVMESSVRMVEHVKMG